MSDQGSQANLSSGPAGNNLQAIKTQLSQRFQKNRHLVLKLHSLLTWEQDFYSFVIGGGIAFIFLILRFLDMSVITTLSFFGIVLAVLDYSLPLITKSLCDTSKWTDKDAQKYDKICQDLAKSYLFVKMALNAACDYKQTNPHMYYPALLSTLIAGAYFGAQFSNLFLTYLLVSLVVLYPGLEKKNVPQKVFEFVLSKMGRRPASVSGDRKQSTGRRSS